MKTIFYSAFAAVIITFISSAQAIAVVPVDGTESMDGIISVLHEDNFSTKKSRNRFFISDKTGSQKELIGNTKNLRPGARVRIDGRKINGALEVFNQSAATSDYENVSAPQAQAVSPTANVAVIMLNFPDRAPSSLTRADVGEIINGVDSYYGEISYNKKHVTYESFGWYTATRPLGAIGCDLYALGDEAIKVADADVNFQNFSQVTIFMPAGNCPWAGVAYVGQGPSYQTGEGILQISFSAIQPDSISSGILIESHEIGHSFGVWHANFLDCGAVPIKKDPFTGGGCLNIEYGDYFDVMGNAVGMGHMSAPHKNTLGFFDPANITTVTSSGSYVLETLETAGLGVKALKIPRQDGRTLWVEYREPIGRDASFGAAVLGGAFIHIDYSVGSGDAFMIDSTPSSPSSMTDVVYKLGSSYIDPESGMTLTPTMKANQTLTVSIDFGSRLNLLANGGFESSRDSWSNWGTEEVIDSATALEGTKSFHMYDSASSLRRIYQDIKASPETQYSIRFGVRTKNLGTNQTHVHIDWLNSSGNVIGTFDVADTHLLSGTGDWQEKIAQMQAPLGTAKARINLMLGPVTNGTPKNDAEVWYDNVRFFSDGAEPPPPPPPPPSGNLIANGGFESGTASWLGWSGDESVVSTPVHTGGKSLRFYDGCCASRNIYQEISIEANSTYLMSAFMQTQKIDSGQQSQMVAEWRTASGSVIQKDILNILNVNQNWAQKSTVLTSPQNAAKVRLHLELTKTTNGSNDGAVWFDDVEVIKTYGLEA